MRPNLEVSAGMSRLTRPSPWGRCFGKRRVKSFLIVVLSRVFAAQFAAAGGLAHDSGLFPICFWVVSILLRARAPPWRKGSRILPFGFHSRRAAALRLASERLAIVRLVSVKRTERSTEAHDGRGVGVGWAGAPLSAQSGGSAGTETFVAKNSHVPESALPDSKCDRGSENPFPLSPDAKIAAGAARPEGESIRFNRCHERGIWKVVPPIFE